MNQAPANQASFNQNQATFDRDLFQPMEEANLKNWCKVHVHRGEQLPLNAIQAKQLKAKSKHNMAKTKNIESYNPLADFADALAASAKTVGANQVFKVTSKLAKLIRQSGNLSNAIRKMAKK